MIKPRVFIVLLLLIILGIYYGRSFTAAKFDLKAHLRQYNQLKYQVNHQHDSLHLSYQATSKATKTALLNHASTFLQKTLSQQIFPYWYGTRWSYSGTTSNPREGKIACGYFVTTTLQHVGFRLNRYRLAQQAASIIIKRLCLHKSVKVIGNNDTDKLVAYLRKQPDGLYILGLDTHVGFVEKHRGKIEFIHASYSSQRSVVRENVLKSIVVNKSSLYMIGNLLGNKKLIHKWLKKQKV